MKKEVEQFISVGGYGYSGGSLVKDLLREFSECTVFDPEFRLIKDPYGLMHLENNLVHNWSGSLDSHVAIKDFLWLAEKLYVKNAKYERGMNYKEEINSNLLNISKDYIKKLTQYECDGTWYILEYKIHTLERILDKYRRKYLKKKPRIPKKQNIYYSKPSKEEFTVATKEYLKKIFNESNVLKKTGRAVIHNAISFYNPKQGFEYFDNIKMVLVDRDPRDIYVDLLSKKDPAFIGSIAKHGVNEFIEDFKNRRSRQPEYIKDKRILILRFEELILDYDNKLDEIMNFLKLPVSEHINKKRDFNPEISKKNLGLWKNYPYQDEIDKIYAELKEYCFNES